MSRLLSPAVAVQTQWWTLSKQMDVTVLKKKKNVLAKTGSGLDLAHGCSLVTSSLVQTTHFIY